jgi:starch-binding outer membrane protein, SusD/RagB family
MKKYTKNIFAIGTIIISLTACDKQLDIDPKVSIDESKALATSQDVKITLTGAYDGISDVNVMGGGFSYINELLGDDAEVRFGGTFSTLDEIWRKTITTSNTVNSDTWRDSYVAINRVNNVLASLDRVDNSDKKRVEGESRFIRGLVYFELVQHFAKTWGDGDNNSNLGVPLILTPTRVVTADDNKPRATVAQVYTQILDDLTKAEALLPATQSGSNTGFATRNAVTAILSRVYLMQGNYAAARDAANKVITSNAHSLSSTFGDVFSDEAGQSENIFKIIVTDQDGVNDLNTFYASTANQGRGDVRVQAKHLTLYEAGDIRGKFFEVVSRNTFSLKFADRYGDVPVVRLAEMYLTRAEANFRLGTIIGATPAADINLLRTRAGLKASNTLTLESILKERKLELAFEGLQLFDLKRTKRNVGTKLYSDKSLILPIPQREIDTNKELKQNEGY